MSLSKIQSYLYLYSWDNDLISVNWDGRRERVDVNLEALEFVFLFFIEPAPIGSSHQPW